MNACRCTLRLVPPPGHAGARRGDDVLDQHVALGAVEGHADLRRRLARLAAGTTFVGLST